MSPLLPMRQRSRTFPLSDLACFAIGVASLASVVLFASLGSAKTWTDPTGRYQVDGELVAADDAKAIIRNDKGELLVLQLKQLSQSDRAYVDDYLSGQARAQPEVPAPNSESGSDANEPKDPPQQTDTQSSVKPKPSDPAKDTPRLPGLKTTSESNWNLKDGQVISGRLIGFGREALVLVRRDGDVLVNGTKFDELSAAYQKIVPDVVSRIDNVEVGDRESLEDHLADGGAGPFRYELAGIQVEGDQGGVVTIPVSLLRPADQEVVQPGMKRWLAAQEKGVEENVREETAKTERLLLDSYQRLQDRSPAYPTRPAPTAASPTGPGAVPPVHPVRMIDLQLQAATAGVTDIWEVLLYPSAPYGYPRTVVVPAENSRGAEIAATRNYPRWRVGPVRKLSY